MKNSKLVLLIVAALSLCITANADDDYQPSKNDGLRYTKQFNKFEAVKTKVTNQAQFSHWLNENKSNMGFVEGSKIDINVISNDVENVQLYRIEQKVSDIPVFAHQSTIVVESGQPSFALINASSYQAESALTTEEVDRISRKFLDDKGVTFSEEINIEQVYWREDKSLIPAISVSGSLFQNEQLLPMAFVIDKSANVLHQTSTMHSMDYEVLDVDLMCRRLAINNSFNYEQLLGIAYQYQSSYPLASSVGSSYSNVERKLTKLLDHSSDFMKQQLNLDGVSQDPSVEMVAFVGNNFAEKKGINCSQNNTTNAFWLTYSNQLGIMHIHTPFLQNPEVIMHELGHGIVSFSSQLIYQGQSGALNEAYGDVLGVTFSAWVDNNLSAPSRKNWRLHQGTNVIRDFIEPYKTKVPDHYKDRYRGSEDEGGVHINSSMLNHSFYLLSVGGKHRRLGGIDVPAIGVKKALKIWHYGVTKLLTPTSSFRDARYAFAKSAELIYGKYSIERTAVHKAFDAIGVPGAWSINKKPIPQEKNKTKTKPVPDVAENKEKTKTKTETKQKVPKEKDTAPKQPASFSNKMIFAVIGLILMFVFVIWKLLQRFKPAAPNRTEFSDYQNQASANQYSAADYADQKQQNRQQKDQQKNQQRANDDNDQSPYLYLHAEQKVFPLYQRQLESSGITIGRSEKASVTMSHQSVSSFHVKLTYKPGKLYIEDLGSSYGTLLNNAKIKEHQLNLLANDSVFYLADLECRLSTSKKPTLAKVQPSSYLHLISDKGTITINSEQASNGRLVIGRSAQCELTLSAATVSSRHGEIFYQNNQWFYVDIGSSNGSFIKIKSSDEEVELPANKAIALDSQCLELRLADYVMKLSTNSA